MPSSLTSAREPRKSGSLTVENEVEPSASHVTVPVVVSRAANRISRAGALASHPAGRVTVPVAGAPPALSTLTSASPRYRPAGSAVGTGGSVGGGGVGPATGPT